MARQPREAADLVVCLRRPQIGRDVFELSLRSQIPGEEYEARDFGHFDLDGQELPSYLAAVLDPSFARFPGAHLAENAFDLALAAWNVDFLATLADLGKGLGKKGIHARRSQQSRLTALTMPNTFNRTPPRQGDCMNLIQDPGVRRERRPKSRRSVAEP